MKRSSFTLAALVPFVLAGCNGNDLSKPGAPGTGGLTGDNSDDVGHAIAAAVAGGGGAGGGGEAAAASNASSFTDDGSMDDCYAVTGDESDADGDWIPANALYTLTDCTWSEEGWTAIYDGTQSISDPHPDVADYAFDSAYDLTVAFTDGAGNSENDHWTGSDSANQSGDVYTYAQAFDVDFSGVYDGQSYAGEYTQDFTWEFTLTSETSGTEIVSGTWSQTFDGETVSASIATTDPLVIDASCDSGIVAGTIVATSGSATETITWTGCDQYTLSYDGS